MGYLEPAEDQQPPSPPSLFSFGTEIYYGLLNSTLGVSTGLRFTTLCPPPVHSQVTASSRSSEIASNGGYSSFPYIMTLTLNPLMGNLSSTYAVKAGPHLALCSKFDFNFYSYESGWEMGGELWRMKNGNPNSSEDVEWARRMIRPDWLSSPSPSPAAGAGDRTTGAPQSSLDSEASDEHIAGVLKARIDQNWRIRLLWEGRFKEVLFMVGASLDLKRREQIFRGLGCEIAYSS
jgi:distribution and morphology protein 10